MGVIDCAIIIPGVVEKHLKPIRILEVHHEMGINWSHFTCETISYTLTLLDYKILKKHDKNKNWFIIEYIVSD